MKIHIPKNWLIRRSGGRKEGKERERGGGGRETGRREGRQIGRQIGSSSSIIFLI